MCHDELVVMIPNEEDPNKNDYFCFITSKQLFEFNYKSEEKNMPTTNKEDSRGEKMEGGIMPSLPEDEHLPTEEETEEEKIEEEQPFLFKDDKVYNELHLTRIDLEDAIKRIDKKLYHTKAERKVLAKRQKENKEAVEIYEKLRTDEE